MSNLRITCLVVLLGLLTCLDLGHAKSSGYIRSPVTHADAGSFASLGRTPPLGWNSWNHFRCTVTEEVVIQSADILVSSGLAAAGYRHVNVDDCWQADQRDENGRLTHNPVTFPSGIKALADYVHSKGLKLGIYSDAGYLTCEGKLGSLGYEEIDAQTFADWGVDYLKYDNCYGNNTDIKQNYIKMRDALLATNRTIYFSMCEWGQLDPATWARGIAHSWRTTKDISDIWIVMLAIAHWNNYWADYAGPGGWNDPDMLEVGNGGMTLSEYRVHFSLWALMKSPLLIGCDVRSMSEETRDLLANEEVIAVNQDPLGVQGKRIYFSLFSQIWTGPLTSNRTVVALINTAPWSLTLTVTWDQLGLNANQEMDVMDLWKNGNVPGRMSGSFSSTVARHDVTLVILRPTRKAPLPSVAVV